MAAPKLLNPRQKHMPMLFALSLTNQEIGSLLGYSAGRVSTLRNSEVMQPLIEDAKRALAGETGHVLSGKFIEDRVQSLMERYDEAAPLAFERTLQLMDTAESEATMLNAAKDILDRAPNAPKTRREEQQDRNVHISFGVEEVNALRAVLAENGTPYEIVEGAYESAEAPIERETEPQALPEGLGTVSAMPPGGIVPPEKRERRPQTKMRTIEEVIAQIEAEEGLDRPRNGR